MSALTNVLVIEDSQHIAYVLSELLRERGLQVVATGDGREGLRIAREQGPQLILSDFNLPDLTGLEVLLELRNDEATKDIPFVLVTAHGNARLRDECLLAGAKAILFKPFSVDELFDTITPFLNN